MTKTDACSSRSPADAGIVDRADRERLGEDLRKLYVALTRARYATWIGVAPLKDLERSAFGYLLGGGRRSQRRVAAGAGTWRDGCPDIAVEPAPAAGTERFLRKLRRGLPVRRAARSRALREHWWIASYSALKTVGEARLRHPRARPTRRAKRFSRKPG
jgi:exodeoxyribonuclease V beta subunit